MERLWMAVLMSTVLQACTGSRQQQHHSLLVELDQALPAVHCNTTLETIQVYFRELIVSFSSGLLTLHACKSNSVFFCCGFV